MSGQFIAAGENGTCYASADGKAWKEVLTGKEGEVFNVACMGGGRVVVGARYGGQATFATTANGVDWTPSFYDAKYSNYVRGMFFYRGKFHAAGGDQKPEVRISSDGATWSDPVQGEGRLLRRFAVSGDRVVGVGDYGRRSATTDGTTWSDTAEPKPAETCIDVAFGAGVFVGAGLHGLRMSSADGLTWNHLQIGEEGEHINAMLWDGSRFVGIGLGATYTSTDGATWERHSNQNAPTRAVFGNGVFAGTRYRGRLLLSEDAIEWREVQRVAPDLGAVAFGELG